MVHMYMINYLAGQHSSQISVCLEGTDQQTLRWEGKGGGNEERTGERKKAISRRNQGVNMINETSSVFFNRVYQDEFYLSG